MPLSRRSSANEASRYRFASPDVFAALLLVGWCALGFVKISCDVRDYRAQQAAIAAFATRYPPETLRLFSETGGTPIARAPYDPAAGRWLLGEVVGYLLTLVVAAAGCRRVRRRRVSVQVKWLSSPRRHAEARRRARPHSPPVSASGNVAADRLSVIVWSDHVARLEKERA